MPPSKSKQIRFGNKFDYFASVPNELQSLMVPSMLLQPIVENSILHGVRDRSSDLLK